MSGVSVLILDVFVLFFSPAVAIPLLSRYLRPPPPKPLPTQPKSSSSYPSCYSSGIYFLSQSSFPRGSPISSSTQLSTSCTGPAGRYSQSGNSLHLKAIVDYTLPGDSGEYTPVYNHEYRIYKTKKTRHEVVWRRGCRRTRRDKIFFRP